MKHPIARALATLTVLSSLAACGEAPPFTAAPPTGPVVVIVSPAIVAEPVAPPRREIEFMGQYTRYALTTFKNGRRFVATNAQGTSTLLVDAGRVTFVQEYPQGSGVAHVTQLYSFTDADVRPVDGGYDVALTFVKMDSDTDSYKADQFSPKLEARMQAGGWDMALVAMDENNVWAGAEFR